MKNLGNVDKLSVNTKARGDLGEPNLGKSVYGTRRNHAMLSDYAKRHCLESIIKPYEGICHHCRKSKNKRSLVFCQNSD